MCAWRKARKAFTDGPTVNHIPTTGSSEEPKNGAVDWIVANNLKRIRDQAGFIGIGLFNHESHEIH